MWSKHFSDLQRSDSQLSNSQLEVLTNVKTYVDLMQQQMIRSADSYTDLPDSQTFHAQQFKQELQASRQVV